MRQALNLLMMEFYEGHLPLPRVREAEFFAENEQVQFVLGTRGSGKTYFCYQQMYHLFSLGVLKEQIIYLDFSDERIYPFDAGDFELILDGYHQRFPERQDESCYLFLENVDLVDGWSKYVASLVDNPLVHVVVTSASETAKTQLLADVAAANVHFTYLFPFSFKEYLRFRDVEVSSEHASGQMATLRHHFEQYVQCGGMPGVQNLNAVERREYHRQLLDQTVLWELVERCHLTNVGVIRALLRHLLRYFHVPFSVNRFYRDLRAMEIRCTKNKLYEVLTALEDAFACYEVNIYSTLRTVSTVNPKKYYWADPGLPSSLTVVREQHYDALLANVVYMSLRRRGYQVHYYVSHAGYEVDFVATRDKEPPLLIQCLWEGVSGDDSAKKLKALQIAKQQIQDGELMMINAFDKSQELPEGVHVVSACEWLLDE